MQRIKKFLIKNKTIIFLLIIITFAIFERFAYLESRPDWYLDEGSNSILAWNLMHGRMELQGTEQTMIPHFPLFYLISGIFTLIFGKTILALRILSALCTVLSTLLLYFIGKEIKNSTFGILTAASFCLLGQTMMVTRYGFSSNLATLEIMIFLFFLIKYSATKTEKWLYSSAIISALIVFTEYYLWGILFIYPIILWKEKIKILKVLTISFSLVAIFFVAMLVIKSEWFLSDIRYYFINRPLLSSINQGANGKDPLSRLCSELYKWITQTPLMFIGFLGLLFSFKQIRPIIICFLALLTPIFLYGQSSFIVRNEILLSPFITIGIAFFIYKSYEILKSAFMESFRSKLFFNLFFIFLVLTMFYRDSHGVIEFLNKNTPIQSSGKDCQDIKSVAEYINEKVKKDDYVIVSDNISILINSRTSDIFFVAAYEKINTEVMSPDFFSEKRFLFDHSPEKALYYVEDKNMMKDILMEHPSLRKILNQMDSWPIVYEVGKFSIHQNLTN